MEIFIEAVKLGWGALMKYLSAYALTCLVPAFFIAGLKRLIQKISFFDKYLSIWAIFCTEAGVAILRLILRRYLNHLIQKSLFNKRKNILLNNYKVFMPAPDPHLWYLKIGTLHYAFKSGINKPAYIRCC